MIRCSLTTLDDFIVPWTTLDFRLPEARVPGLFGEQQNDSMTIEFTHEGQKYRIELKELLLGFPSDENRTSLFFHSSRIDNNAAFTSLHNRLLARIQRVTDCRLFYRAGPTIEIDGARLCIDYGSYEYDEEMLMTPNFKEGLGREAALGVANEVLSQLYQGKKSIEFKVPGARELLHERPMLDPMSYHYFTMYEIPQNRECICKVAEQAIGLVQEGFSSGKEGFILEDAKVNFELPMRKYRDIACYPRTYEFFPDKEGIRTQLVLPEQYQADETRYLFKQQACELQRANFDLSGSSFKSRLEQAIHQFTLLDLCDEDDEDRGLERLQQLLSQVRGMRVICYNGHDSWPPKKPLDISVQYFAWPGLSGSELVGYKSRLGRDMQPVPKNATPEQYKASLRGIITKAAQGANWTFVNNIYKIIDLELV